MSQQYTNTYFAAANTSNGFIGHFGKIFDAESLDRIYILKGGPGTGKSYLMRKIGKEAEEHGYDVEYFLCSSDTNSLDGILIPSIKTAIIDGTSPHASDPILPGAADEIINLGEFFNIKKLTEQKDVIIKLIRAKSELYTRAYAFLRCAGSIKKEYNCTVSPYVMYKKLNDFAERLMSHIKNGDKWSEQIRLLHTYGTCGEVFLDTFYKKAETHYVIEDKYNISHILLSLIYEKLKEKGHNITVSYSPDIPEHIDGIYINSLKISFTVGTPQSEDDKVINMCRFINKDGIKTHKRRLNFMKSAYESVIKEALLYLANVKPLHEELEKIYISSMDFGKKEKMTEKLCKKIFK